MRRSMKALSAISLLLSTTAMALAGPEGVYNVRGVEFDGTEYGGIVTVVRTGETYRVTWKIDGYTYHGSGIGAAPLENGSIMGPAGDDDNVLTVGYTGGYSESGTAFYMEEEDGVWRGIWTEFGSHRVATEDWHPKDVGKSPRILEY